MLFLQCISGALAAENVHFLQDFFTVYFENNSQITNYRQHCIIFSWINNFTEYVFSQHFFAVYI